MKKIYCAGPLFNPREKEDMLAIADALESNGYTVFLPQRDGIELSQIRNVLVDNGHSLHKANDIMKRFIFYIDVYQIAESDGIVINLNGRVPDEGAMVEAGIAWTLGNAVVLYKNDSRSIFAGEDNPLVAGLSNFRYANHLDDISPHFDRIFSNGFSRTAIHKTGINITHFNIGNFLYKYYTELKHNNFSQIHNAECNSIFEEVLTCPESLLLR